MLVRRAVGERVDHVETVPAAELSSGPLTQFTTEPSYFPGRGNRCGTGPVGHEQVVAFSRPNGCSSGSVSTKLATAPL